MAKITRNNSTQRILLNRKALKDVRVYAIIPLIKTNFVHDSKEAGNNQNFGRKPKEEVILWVLNSKET